MSAEELREAIVQSIASTQNVPFVGPKQRRIADALLDGPLREVIRQAAIGRWVEHERRLYLAREHEAKNQPPWMEGYIEALDDALAAGAPVESPQGDQT